MTELDAARQIVAGLLPSPWQLGGMTLFAIRITGTGLSYRAGHDEYVWRDSSIFQSPEFLARCNGLPVIWVHPENKPGLDSKEFNKRAIGTIMLPYLKGDETWGIARIYDAEAIEKMSKGKLSTSPGVVFLPTDGNETVELNGETFLIEGNPSLLDHIAVLDVGDGGVWDKGGDPTGVQNDTLNEGLANMADEADEKKASEEQARKDSERLDAIMDGLKRMDARMDAMEAEKAAEKDRARHDAARKDRFGKRKDGEAYKDWKSRHDADEAAMCDALEKGGVEKDKARKDAKDCRMDAEESEKKDDESFEKWASEEAEEPEHKEDKAKKDAEEKEKMEREEKDRKDAARHDAAHARENADLRRQLDAMQATLRTLTTEVPQSERDALARAQARADGVAAMFGNEAPRPIAGEVSLPYRRRLMEHFKKHSAKFRDTRFDSADAAMLEPIEAIVYNDAVEAAKTPALARPGLLMEMVRTDRAGRRITEYVGDPMAWMAPFMSQGASGRIRRNPNSNEGI
jgi:hypothetical protein